MRKYTYEMIESCIIQMGCKTTEIRFSAGINVLYHIIKENGEIAKLSMNSLYRTLQDNFDITRPCAESRARKFQQDFISTTSELTKARLEEHTLLPLADMTNHDFMYALADEVLLMLKANK